MVFKLKCGAVAIASGRGPVPQLGGAEIWSGTSGLRRRRMLLRQAHWPTKLSPISRITFGATPGTPPSEFVPYEFALPGGFFSYDATTCLCSADDLIAICIAFPSSSFWLRYYRTVVHTASLFPVRELVSSFARAMLAESLTPLPPKNSLYLAVLTVDGCHRGKGYGKRLFNRVIGRAAASGLSAVALDVSSTNRTMQCLVEGLGFERTAVDEMHGRKQPIGPYWRYERGGEARWGKQPTSPL